MHACDRQTDRITTPKTAFAYALAVTSSLWAVRLIQAHFCVVFFEILTSKLRQAYLAYGVRLGLLAGQHMRLCFFRADVSALRPSVP